MDFIALQRAKLHYVFENIFHVVERLVSKKEAKMNKIFKVIWSKSKQCYVVVSELAKNKTGKKKIVVASVFAALAMMGSVQDISANSYSAGGGTTGAFGNDHIAIGTSASAPGTGSNGANTAIGKRATASGGNDTAVGVSSSATGNGSSAFGQEANASGSGSVAIGYQSVSSGRRAVALGGDANGTKVTASADYATAIGSGAQAKNENATALGANSTAIDEATIAIGKNATAGNTAFLAKSAIAIGDTAKAERLDSVAIGKSTTATGIASTAIGENAQADKDNDNALGNNVHARGGGSSAVGYLVNTSGNQAFGAGSNTTVSGTAAVGIGYMNTASGDRAISIGADDNGKNNTASGDASIAIGKAANAGGTTAAASSIAIGDNAAASGVASTAVGKAALADKDNDSSFGNSSHASGGGSSAIGYLVTTSGNQAFGAGSFTTVSGPAAVGIGYSNEVTGDRAVAIGSALDGVKTGVSGNYGVAIGAAARAKNLEATAIGKKALSSGQSAIAIGSDTSSAGNYAISIGVEANASQSDAIAVGRKSTAGDTAMSLGYKAAASGNYSNAIGQEANSSALNSLALGRKANASLANAVAIGSSSTTATSATSEGSTTIGGKNITWTGGVLSSASTPVGMQVSVGSAGSERQIKNVAAGKVDATSTDAINGSQLYAVADALRTKYVSINSTISNNQNNDGATGSDSVAIGPDAAATKADSVAMGRSVKANGQQSIAVGKSAEAKQDYNVAIGSEVVADGNNSVAMGRYASSTGTAALAIGAYGNNKSTASGNYSIAIGRDVTASGVDSIATGRDSKATAEKALAYGANAQALAINSIAIGADSQANVEKGIALGAGSKANVASGVAGYNANTENIARTDKYSGLTGVALNSNLGALSVGVTDASGAATSTRQIVGVAAGKADTDAVNVAQLKSVNLAFTGNSGSGDVNLSKSKLAVEGGTDSFITTTAANKKLEINTTQGKLKNTSGTVSVDGNNGLAVAQNVADVINQVSADQSIKYKANGTGANSVKLSDGLNFKDGTTTTATVGANGEVSFDLNTAIKTQISNNTTDITANKGKIATNTTNIAANTTALARNISLGADSGTASSQSLKDGNVAFAVKGATGDYISTNMNGSAVEISTKRATISSNATTGEASVAGNDGLATAKNVADAINAAADKAKAASAWKLTTNSSTADTTFVAGGDTVDLVGGKNITVEQDGTDKKKITIKTADDLDVDTITAKNTVTVGSGANAITLNGATGAVSGNSFTAGNTVITTTGLTSGTGTNAVSFGTNGISAGGQVISNVASGTVNNNATDNSNVANIGDVKQAVANLSQNLNITDGTHDGTVDLKNQKLNVAGANGVTATVNNQTITVGLDTDTVNATTKGIGLTGDTGSTGNKYLKDGDVSFAVTGDSNLVSTKATTTGVQVSVDSAKIKDLAAGAVTVSKDAQADNPITVTPTTGTNSKDYAIGIDTTKLASKTELTYRANNAADANAKKVSLSKGLNFVNGTSTEASVDADGKVKIDLNATTKDAIDKSQAAMNRTVSLGADSGTASSQSLKDGNVAFNVKGAANSFITTEMDTTDTNTVNIKTQTGVLASNTATGKASVTGADGLATAQNVADAINAAADKAKAASTWNLTTNSSTADTTSVAGGDTVDLVNGDNIEITQDGTDKKKITVATKKDITVDSVTANNKITVGSGANKITLDGTDGSVTGKAFTGTTFTGTLFTGTSFTAGNTVINTNGLTNGTTAITGTGVMTDNVTVGGISIDKTAGINAGNKVISNVASGGTTLTNAANIGDVQNAVANLSQNLNITDGTHDGTVDLKNQKLNVAGANGVTANVNNQTITVGLDTDTVNATTKGIGLTGDTGSTGNKYLKDGDVSFAVTGDSNLVSTKATTTGVQVSVDSAKIKDLAAGAVTVSKDAQADNPITVTPTTGTNSKDYAIGIDTTKLASKTELTYRANNAADANAKKVSLSKGLNFVNGTSTEASVDADGKVKIDLNATTKDAIDKSQAAMNRTVSLGADSGTASSQSLKDGNVAFNVKGAANSFITTEMDTTDTNTVNIKTQTGVLASNTATGKASITGADGLATAQNVADAINAAADKAKASSAWKLTTNSSTADTTSVAGGDTVDLVGGKNITVEQDGTDKKKITIKTADDLDVDTITAKNTVTVGSGANAITLNGATGAVSGNSFTAGNTVITTTGLTSGTGTNAVSFGTNGISAGGQVISNVASGTVNNNATDNSNVANIGDVKQAVANLSQNLNITDGTHDGTVDLKNQKLNVAGANGVTATVNNQTITVGLDTDTVNATTKGIGLTGDTGSTGNKYLKDGDVSFAVTGDSNLVSTKATTTGVQVSVDSAKIKDLAAGAVTVSKDAQADNPITVTPTTGTNSKDYAIGIDTTKLASKTELTYRANNAADANAKKVSLSKGLNFVNGTSTEASVDADGKVKIDLNATTKDAIDKSQAAMNRTVSLGADSGTASSQSLKDGNVAFNVKGAANSFITTEMDTTDTNTVNIKTQTGVLASNTATGKASITGADGLATAQNVADAINAAADKAKAASAWNLTTNSSTTDTTSVAGGDTVDLVNGDNIEITQDGTDKKKITVATKKDITVDSVTANNKITVGSGANKITLDGTDGSVTGKAFTGTTFTGTLFTGTSFTAGNTVINTNGLTNGTTAITGTGVMTDNVTVGGISIDKTAGINAGNKVISNVASGGTTLTNAANIGDVQNAVANLSQNLNITDGTHDGTVDLKNQKLNVAGANGVTANVNNQTITVGLDTDTVNATTKGIGLTGDTGSTGNKYLKDGDVSFAVTGDGSLVSTSATAAGVKVAVNSANITAGADGTITGPTTDGVATAKNVADAINAAKKASKTDITANTGEAANATTGNVTLTSTTATDGHTIYDVKINDKVTLGTGANAVTIDGTTGAITGKTATIGGITVNGTANTIGGLSNTTWNGTAVSGRAATEDQLKAATGATTLKFTGDVATNTGSVNLKDDTFGIKGDGKYISTDVNGKNVNLTVSEAEVKKSAVAAVTVSTDTTDANNPLTVTPTTSADGTTKDYKVTIDGTKIANKTNLSYKANSGTAKQVSLADGLDFTNGTMTTATIDDKGVVKYSVNTATITAGTDGTITAPTADGVATAKNVADAINAAKKASKTDITANTGEAANATTGNVTLTSTTATDGHTIYDVKINDKVTLGTGANAVTVDGTTGAITGKTATIGGVTVNGTANTIGGLSNTTWNGTATTGRAATEDQLKAVADSASSQKWKITADKTGTLSNQTGTKKDATVGKDETVELVAGDNLTIDQNERKFTYSLNKDLKGLTSVGIGDGTTQTITFNGANKTAVIGGVTVDGANNFVTGLANTTWNGTATTGRAATEDQLKSVADAAKSNTDAVALKFTGDVAANTGSVNLKDDTFGIKGDGQYISTDVNGKNVKLTVSETAVKKSAVNAVTVSTDTTDTNNPLTITSTGAGDGSTKNYVIAIDGTKIANKTNLSYKANNGTAKQVSLADGLDFTNGTMTTATIDDKGGVKYSVNMATITAGTDGTITAPTTDGVATAKNVADAINAAKKAGKTEITANTGEAANATTGNIKLSSTTEADGHTKYDVKLNDKVTLGTGTNAVTIDGTAGKATIGTSVIDGVNNTFTTGGANSVKLDGASGTVTGLTNKTLTVPGFATQGRAATEEQLKVVADQASKNAAASATEVTVNGGNQANVTSGNLLLTKTTDGTDGHAKFDIKLNDKVEFGTGNDKITVDGTNGTITAKNINASGDVNAKNVTTTADVTAGGTVTGNTLKAGNVTVNGGATNTITGLSNTTWTGSTTTPDRAATEGQLQQAINSAASSATFKFDGDNNSQQTMNLQNGTFKVTGDTMITTNATSAGVGLSLNTNNVKIAYAANGTNGQTTSLASGFNFTDGDHTKATVATNGVVKYDAKTSTISVANGHATSSGNDLATADNVADAINQMTQNNAGNTTQLRQEISKVATETQRVGAHAAAMAALKPIQYDPLEPTQIMAGVGNYRGETAAALGLAHYTNENTMFNVGVSVGGNHNMVNAGVTHKFGYSPEKKNVPDRYKAGPISSIYVMQDEMTQLRSENEAYKAKLDKQQSEIDALKAAVDQLLASKA